MHLSRALSLIPLLAACGSNPPAPDPGMERPQPVQSSTSASSPPAEIVTALDAAFLIGAWAPLPDPEAIDRKVDQLVADGMDEAEAVMSSYQSRFIFGADQSCEFGLSVAGNLDGVAMSWESEQEGPDQLSLLLYTETSELPRLTVTRVNDLIAIEGDPAVNGQWVRLVRGEEAELEDQLTGGLAIKHIENRKKSAEARQQIEESLAQMEESMSVMVQMVKAVCEAEVTLGDTSRNQPISNESYNELKQSMPLQEALLMAMPVSTAPKPPVQARHVGQSQAFDEHWLTGTWSFKSDEMDWDLIMPKAVPEESLPEFKAMFQTLRRTFTIRGTYRNTLGWPEIREDIPGYYCVTPGAGDWCRVTILAQYGSPDVGIERDEIGSFAAYRVGDVLWMEEGEGAFFPYVKIDE